VALPTIACSQPATDIAATINHAAWDCAFDIFRVSPQRERNRYFVVDPTMDLRKPI
jgi:hypothetical protein